jgi:hypothetical protein
VAVDRQEEPKQQELDDDLRIQIAETLCQEIKALVDK